MERVAFMVERTGQRISCLLNPESVVLRRTAGVRTRSLTGGSLAGSGLKDDPLVYTGGGSTQLLLDLLFDVSLAAVAVPNDDVRTLTRPLLELAEGAPESDGFQPLPVVRFVWGKQWNIPGVITAIAERLEQFTPEGAPQRSWLRMRMTRVSEPEPTQPAVATPQLSLLEPGDVSPEVVSVHELIGNGSSEAEADIPAERLDEVAWERYGDSRFWRLIASFNNIANPFEIAAGQLLQLPPLSAILPSTGDKEAQQ